MSRFEKILEVSGQLGDIIKGTTDLVIIRVLAEASAALFKELELIVDERNTSN
jgi:hypothetical protein